MDDAVAAQWANTLRRVADRGAHELRNPLNGLALSLEVVRSRAARSEQASGISPFAEAAHAELERAIPRVEALLALARGASGAVDLAASVRHVAALLGPAMESGGAGGKLTVEWTDALPDVGAASPALRLAVMATLEAAVAAAAAGGEVKCVLGSDAEGTHVAIRPAPELPDELIRACEGEGVSLQRVGGEVRIHGPRSRAA